ncbi:MAG: hypothetical protein BGO01_11910 [Armatimonadetes bacterium 55-13]|nr:hypothetical protein [Armatimonadota bacterium]OJU63494.1 MAG: hypothetical protein BGO01_11910 [Armatimonadetes bacterium 55-13]
MVQRVYEEPEFSEVLERVPLEIRRSLTFEQRSAITAALRESRRKHAIDIRFVIPLIFTQLYFVLFVGKDLRRETQEKMVDRRQEAGRWVIAWVLGIGALVALIVFLVCGYILKSKAGIDLMPDSHASDLLRQAGIR